MIRYIGIIALILVAVLVFQDSKERGMNPWIWAALVIFFNAIAIIVYFIVRKPKIQK